MASGIIPRPLWSQIILFPINIVYPSIIKNKVISFYISDAYDNLLLFGVNGTVVLNKNIRGFKGKNGYSRA